MPNRRGASAGSFSDEIARLLEQLATAPLIELGKPIPDEKHLPKEARRPRIGNCPASHNRLLLDRHARPTSSG